MASSLKLSWIAALAALAALAGIAAGCRSAPVAPPKPLAVQVGVVASHGLNPDGAGRPSPVLLRVYQLRDAGAFLEADFDDLTLRGGATLGGTLVDHQERIVEPGSTTLLKLTIRPETQLLGVIAEYRDLAGSQWRAASPAPAGGLITLFKHHGLTIRLDARAVTIAMTAAGKKGR